MTGVKHRSWWCAMKMTVQLLKHPKLVLRLRSQHHPLDHLDEEKCVTRMADGWATKASFLAAESNLERDSEGISRS